MPATEFPANGANLAVTIRRANKTDLPMLGQFGANLTRMHHAYDTQRFILFEPMEEGYASFLGQQMENENAVILVAELAGRVVGYAFIRLEPASMLDLCPAGAWLHDIYVDTAARGASVGRQLLQASIAVARELGSPSLMLSVSPHNKTAQDLFARTGFRPTMQEMRMDFESK